MEEVKVYKGSRLIDTCTRQEARILINTKRAKIVSHHPTFVIAIDNDDHKPIHANWHQRLIDHLKIMFL